MRFRCDSLLMWLAVAHGVLALACAVGVLFPGERVGGAHQLVKPLKFALSIGIFLATMSLCLPMLSVTSPTRRGFAWLLAISMILEMAAVLVQGLRGQGSHYNEAAAFDRAVWRTMLVAILAATVAMAAIAVVATTRPLRAADGQALTAVSTLAWRAGLWAFQLAAISGFAMGGRGQHTVGAADGGPGLPGVGWSLAHGDLRISHFVALHALQLLPVVACALEGTRLDETGRRTGMVAVIAVHASVVVWTLVRALLGRSPW